MRFAVPLAAADKDYVVEYRGVRISVLSDRIIRVEKGAFTDKRTQSVFCRNFAKPQFKSEKHDDKIVVTTKSRVFYVNTANLKVKVKFLESGLICAPSNRTNLGGTARTLDGTFGVLGGWKGKREKKDHFCLGHVRKGIFATNGVSEFDDSKSFLLEEDGSVSQRGCRSGKLVDKYIFADSKSFTHSREKRRFFLSMRFQTGGRGITRTARTSILRLWISLSKRTCRSPLLPLIWIGIL